MTTANPAPPRPATSIRRFFPEIEGMRGVAALMVVLTHVGLVTGQIGWDHPGNGFAGAVLNKMELGLPIFFVLSGALLYRPYALAIITDTRRPALRPYLWRRALRILPAYWLLVAVALPLLNRDTIHGVWQVVRPVLLLQVYQRDDAYLAAALPNGMGQTWSLSTEVAFYLALPLLAWLSARFAGGATDPVERARRLLVPLAALLPIGFAFAAYTHLPATGPWPTQHFWPIEYGGFLAVGMILATMSASADVSPERVFAPYRLVVGRPGACWLGALATFLLLSGSPLGDPSSVSYPKIGAALVDHVLYLVFCLLLVGPLTAPAARSRLVAATLSNPVARFLGRISYGVFLWHFVVLAVYTRGEVGSTGFWETLAVVVPVTVALALVSYLLVERPALRLRPLLGGAPADPSVVTADRPVRPAERPGSGWPPGRDAAATPVAAAGRATPPPRVRG